MNSKKIITLGVITTLGLGGWFYTAPVRTMGEILDGFKNSNADLISSHIDYGSLRTDMKEQVLLSSSMENGDNSSATLFGKVIGSSLVGNALNTYVTPSGLKMALRKGLPDTFKDLRYNGSFLNLDTYQVLLHRDYDEDMKLTLSRTGIFEWKITHIEMPSSVARTSPNNDVMVELTCTNMKGAFNALEMFKLDNGVYPTEDEGFNALMSNPNPNKYTNYSSDGYLSYQPKDAWGNDIIYVHDRDGVDMVSNGSDGKSMSFVDCKK